MEKEGNLKYSTRKNLGKKNVVEACARRKEGRYGGKERGNLSVRVKRGNKKKRAI